MIPAGSDSLAGGQWPPALLRMFRALGSLKVTLLLLALLAPAITLAYNFEQWRSWPLALPLAALSLNLCAALLTNPVFRRQTPLIVFHLSLVLLLLLIAAGRLSYLRGTLELTEGFMFEGSLTSTDAGPMHGGELAEIRFINQGFSISYATGLRREETLNTVRWLDDSGRWREQVIGDQTPLIVKGYRFYTSHNKGFAILLKIVSTIEGNQQTAAVHLPSYPLNELRQANELKLPGGMQKLWMMLDIDETILDPEKRSEFRLPQEQRLVVRVGDDRQVLRPGESVQIGGYQLHFEGLRSWMGYNVFYDWTLPWLAATSALAVLSLGWHFWRKFAPKAWDA